MTILKIPVASHILLTIIKEIVMYTMQASDLRISEEHTGRIFNVEEQAYCLCVQNVSKFLPYHSRLHCDYVLSLVAISMSLFALKPL
jgi:hypothetical protein